MAASNSSIEWTDATWNPVRGCSRVSAGCNRCYAMLFAHRFAGDGGVYEGLTKLRHGKVDWMGIARFVPEMLAEPLRWREPKRVFVNSMSDLFHESLEFEYIAAVFGVMAACPQHTFQVLTKRPKRAAEWFRWVVAQCAEHRGCERDTLHHALIQYLDDTGQDWRGRRWQPTFFEQYDVHAAPPGSPGARWPLPNVWLGVSAEDQATFDKRLPVLVHHCPAALHFVSAEPLLGPISLTATARLHLDWLIAGGESGPGARVFDLAWARELRDDCQEERIPFFLKQFGARTVDSQHQAGVFADADRRSVRAARELGTPDAPPSLVLLRNRKGGDVAEWPEDLRIREFPETRKASHP